MQQKGLGVPEAINNPLEVQELKLSSKDIRYLRRFQNLKALVLNVYDKHLPVELFEAVGLKSLVITAYEGTEIPTDRFDVFQELECFSFKGSYKFTVTGKGFPHTVFELKKLRHFSIQISSLKDLLRDAFLRFENLEELEIAYQKADQQVLENIFACRTLKKLSLDLRNSSKNAFPSDTLLASVGQLQQLTKLSISGHKLTRLPDSFNQLTKLEELELDRNAFVDLPFQAENFKKLWRLNLGYNKIEKLPSGLLHLENLQELDWYNNPISKHPIYKKGQPVADFIKKINGFEPLTRASAWKVFTTDEADTSSIETPELLRALTVDLQTFQRKTHALLNQRLKNPFDTTIKPEETTLLLLGRKFFGVSKAELTERLTTQKITVIDSLSTEVTHVVLGEIIPKNSVSKITETSLPLATADHLKLFLEQLENPYLKQADDSMADNLMRLLNSTDEENVKLALQMMESGGIPGSVLYHVFLMCFYKAWGVYNPAPALRRTFEKIGPPEMVRLTKLHWQKENDNLSEALFRQEFLDMKRLFDAAFDLFAPALNMEFSQHDRQPPADQENIHSWWVRFLRSMVAKISERDKELSDYILSVFKEKQVFEHFLNRQKQMLFVWLETSGKIQDYVASLLIKDETLDIRNAWFNLLRLPLSMPVEIVIIDNYLFRSTHKQSIQHFGKMRHLKKVIVTNSKDNQNKIDDILGLWKSHASHVQLCFED